MNRISVFALALLAALTVQTPVAPAVAEDNLIGQAKNVAGAVFVERAGSRLPLKAGDRLALTDTVITGNDGSAGITFADNSMMSLGPDTVLALERFQFNSTTNEGVFASRLRSGTLAVKSGKIVQQTPEAMTIRTPAAVLGVRGTEFVVRADDDR
ncbi:MAG: FecR domain-containing protein [Magnetospirillum sp.]|nr:FecR domain-containing protein [Magnetospirillum sp.]